MSVHLELALLLAQLSEHEAVVVATHVSLAAGQIDSTRLYGGIFEVCHRYVILARKAGVPEVGLTDHSGVMLVHLGSLFANLLVPAVRSILDLVLCSKDGVQKRLLVHHRSVCAEAHHGGKAMLLSFFNF